MINYNLLLYSLLDRTHKIDAFGKVSLVNYTEGDLFELNKKLLNAETKYPIIWLQSGYTVEESRLGDITLSNCNFFIITKGDQHDYYKKRYETTYQDMLFPLFEWYKGVFRKTRGISLETDPIRFITLPFNDVTELNGGGKRNPQLATVTDIWDAMVLNNIEITIKADCFPQFLIKKS